MQDDQTELAFEDLTGAIITIERDSDEIVVLRVESGSLRLCDALYADHATFSFVAEYELHEESPLQDADEVHGVFAAANGGCDFIFFNGNEKITFPRVLRKHTTTSVSKGGSRISFLGLCLPAEETT